MTKLSWTPWHKVVTLRDGLRSGELSLSIFAADLYDVAMQQGRRPVYEDPAQFFALTYPTYNLRELARDVVLRLAGRSGRAIRQLELPDGSVAAASQAQDHVAGQLAQIIGGISQGKELGRVFVDGPAALLHRHIVQIGGKDRQR